MQLSSNSFSDGQKIPGDYAFCIPDPAHHVCLGRNLNPQLTRGVYFYFPRAGWGAGWIITEQKKSFTKRKQ